MHDWTPPPPPSRSDVLLDYTLIPKAIAETMAKAGAPLTDDQKMLLSGALAGYQESISVLGLSRVVSNLESQRAARETKKETSN